MASRVQVDLNSDDYTRHGEDDGKLKPGKGVESFKLASFWKSQVDIHDKAYSRWHVRGNKVIKRYRDERSKLDEEGQRKMNLLWANIKVMKPAIYSKCPTPIVDRLFLDRDPVGRLASQMLERSLVNELKNNFHNSVTAAVYDRLLPGRGVIWARYEPKIGESESIPSMNPTGIEDQLEKIGNQVGDKSLTEETEEEEQLEETGETVIDEKVIFDYVEWRDFYVFPAKARTWEEVQAVGKKVYISKKEAKERFGEEIGKSMQPDTTALADTSFRSTGYSDTAIFRDINERSICCYEIWNKSDMRVYWFSPGYEYLADVKDDPLELTGFFPVPRPLFATVTNESLIPVPDYWEWQDQAVQIDELTSRIAMLTKACKVAGVYNAANTSIGRLLNEAVENKLIPEEQWATFVQLGGLKGAVDFIPLDQIQSAIKTLQEVRQQCMIDLDQITGLSDVIRGTSDSRETLGGIRLKNNNAGTRLTESQEDIARFCRDAICLAAQIICKHFDDTTIIESSGIMYHESLQPEAIMEELDTTSPSGGSATNKQRPQIQGQLGQPNQATNTQQGIPQQPPQVPGNNIVPFPHPAMGSASGQAQGQSGQQQQPQGQQQPTPLVPQLPPVDPKIIAIMKVQAALKLLRDDVVRKYRIDIETDSTIFGDKVQERQDATEFIGAVGQFMGQFETIATQVPEATPLLARMLQWGVRKYRTGRDLESEIDSFVAKMERKAKQAAANPQPDPEVQKQQMEMQREQMKAQAQAQNDQRDAQRQQMEDQRQAQLDQATDAREKQKMQLEMAMEQESHKIELEKMQMEMQLAREKHNLELQKLQMQAHTHAQKAQTDMHMANQEHAIQTQQMHNEAKHDERQLQLKKQEGEQKHELKQKEMKQKHQERKDMAAHKAKQAKKAS